MTRRRPIGRIAHLGLSARLVAVSQGHQPVFRLPFLVWILAMSGREALFVKLSRLLTLVQIIVRSCPQEQCFWCVLRDFLPGGKIPQNRVVLVKLGVSKGEASPGFFVLRTGRDRTFQNGNGSAELFGVDERLT